MIENYKTIENDFEYYPDDFEYYSDGFNHEGTESSGTLAKISSVEIDKPSIQTACSSPMFSEGKNKGNWNFSSKLYLDIK